MDADLRVRGVEVVLHSALRQVQASGDLLVGAAVGGQLEHLRLPIRHEGAQGVRFPGPSRIEDDLGRLAPQDEATPRAGLDRARDLIDTELPMHKVPARSRGQRPANELRLRHRCQHDDTHALSQLRKDVQSRAPGHPHVEKANVRQRTGGDLERGERVRCFDNLRHGLYSIQDRA